MFPQILSSPKLSKLSRDTICFLNITSLNIPQASGSSSIQLQVPQFQQSHNIHPLPCYLIFCSFCCTSIQAAPTLGFHYMAATYFPCRNMPLSLICCAFVAHRDRDRGCPVINIVLVIMPVDSFAFILVRRFCLYCCMSISVVFK